MTTWHYIFVSITQKTLNRWHPNLEAPLERTGSLAKVKLALQVFAEKRVIPALWEAEGSMVRQVHRVRMDDQAKRGTRAKSERKDSRETQEKKGTR